MNHAAKTATQRERALPHSEKRVDQENVFAQAGSPWRAAAKYKSQGWPPHAQGTEAFRSGEHL
jgi:hypothetical protein